MKSIKTNKEFKSQLENRIREYTRNITDSEVEDLKTKRFFQPIKQLEFVIEHILGDIDLEFSERSQDDKLIFAFEKKHYGYMIGTRAFHLLGDISRDEPDLCAIIGETKGYYIGSWVTGFGFMNVMFSKATTRPLTDEEVESFLGTRVQIASHPSFGFSREQLTKSRKVVEENK